MTEEKTCITLKNLPSEERPREKIFADGVSALSNTELIAVLLGSGTRGESALRLAERVLSSDRDGLVYLMDCTPQELCSISGIGPAKAAVLMSAAELGRRLTAAPGRRRACVANAGDAAALFMDDMRHLKNEHFRILLLDVRCSVISIEEISSGSVCGTEVHPREVFAPALRRGAVSMVLVHNHPSGNPTPSLEDAELTERLCDSGSILGINVLDHIIIGDGCYFSMKAEGRMQ